MSENQPPPSPPPPKPIKTLLKNCKTLQHLKSIHAHSITKSHPIPLPTLLFTLTNTLLTHTHHHHHHQCLHYALSLFHHTPNPSTFPFNLLIKTQTLLSLPLPSILTFIHMRRSDVPPDTHTFPFVLTACSRLSVPSSLGPAIHSQSLRFGLAGDLFVRNTLMKVYSNHGSVADARQMFDESPVRDAFSHNTIIDAYVKIGELGIARRVFDAMPCRDVVSWGTLLSGYARMGWGKEAIGLFDQMLSLGFMPDGISLVAALSACAQIGALDRGRAIHEYIGKRSPVTPNVYVSTALVDMYAKCGCMDLAREVFEASPYKNVFTWNAMVVGFAMYGHGELSMEYFYRMLKGGVRPDGVSFLGVLVGCSHAGLVDTARWIFDQMEGVHGVRRELKHYGCMADLMGRAGLIEEVLDMIKGMPMEADAFVWGGLLGGCRIYGNVEVAEIAFKHLMELDPDDSGIYTVMANVYANAERWDDVGRMRRLLDARGVKKNVGCSSVRREFVAVDDDEWTLEKLSLWNQDFQHGSGKEKGGHED